MARNNRDRCSLGIKHRAEVGRRFASVGAATFRNDIEIPQDGVAVRFRFDFFKINPI